MAIRQFVVGVEQEDVLVHRGLDAERAALLLVANRVVDDPRAVAPGDLHRRVRRTAIHADELHLALVVLVPRLPSARGSVAAFS